MTCRLTAVIEQDKDGAFAYCPELKSCHTQGDTVEEALANLHEAAELYLETMTWLTAALFPSSPATRPASFVSAKRQEA